MRDFDLQLLRLKECLAVTEDQEVAQLLGLTKHAFSDRKKRGAFPKEKLLALKALKPELHLDDVYILTGERSTKRTAAQGMAAAINAQKNLIHGNYGVQQERPPYLTGREEELVGDFRALSEDDKVLIESMVKSLRAKK